MGHQLQSCNSSHMSSETHFGMRDPDTYDPYCKSCKWPWVLRKLLYVIWLPQNLIRRGQRRVHWEEDVCLVLLIHTRWYSRFFDKMFTFPRLESIVRCVPAEWGRWVGEMVDWCEENRNIYISTEIRHLGLTPSNLPLQLYVQPSRSSPQDNKKNPENPP